VWLCGVRCVMCDVAFSGCILLGCRYAGTYGTYSNLNYLARQLKLPSSTHTSFYVTKVGYILTTDYVLHKRNNSYVLHKRNVRM